MPPIFWRLDPLNPTNIIAAILLSWAWWVYHRPNLPKLLVSYHAFPGVMPWAWWGWTALVIAMLLLLSPRGSIWRFLGHLFASLYLGSAAYAFGLGVGGASHVSTNTILSYVSLVLTVRTAVYMATGSQWWARLVDRPPGWLRRLAGLDEERHGRP